MTNSHRCSRHHGATPRTHRRSRHHGAFQQPALPPHPPPPGSLLPRGRPARCAQKIPCVSSGLPCFLCASSCVLLRQADTVLPTKSSSRFLGSTSSEYECLNASSRRAAPCRRLATTPCRRLATTSRHHWIATNCRATTTTSRLATTTCRHHSHHQKPSEPVRAKMATYGDN